MKQVSDNFMAKMQDTLRSWVPRMSINGTEITEDIQTGLSINLGSCGPEEFGIGTAFIPSMTATITDCKTSLQDKEIKLEMGLVLGDGAVEYVPVGYFTVEKPNKGKFATSFTAYGRLMSKMGGTYESVLDYPATISSVISEVSSQTGLTIKTIGFSDVSGLIDIKPEGLNHRDTVQLIAGLLGGFVTENSSGEIVICKYAINDALTVDTAFCYEYPFVHDSPYTVNGLSAVCGENEFSNGDPNIYITNGYMNETQFNICAGNIVGFSYMPGSVRFLGDIRLDPWDSLKVTDDDAVYKIPCMDITHVWDGGLITEVQAPGTTEAEDGSNFKGSLSGRIEQIGDVTDGIETLFEMDKKAGTIRLQAGKLLEILSGGKLIVNAENYKLNEDGTVTITGGSIGGFVIDAEDIVKYDRNGNPILMLDGSDFPYFGYKTADILDPQYGKLGWFIDTEYNAYCHGLQISSTDHKIGTTTTEISEGIKIFFEPINGTMRSVAFGTGGIWSSTDDFNLNDSPILTMANVDGSHDHASLKNDKCTVLLIGHFLRPTTDGDVSLGGADYKWNSFYVNNILAYNSIKVGGINVSLDGHTHSNYSESGHTHSKLAGSKDDVILTGTYLRPSSTNGTITLGGSSYRWNVVYAKSGTINTSDLRQKHSLETDMEKYVAMLDKIEPTSYVLNDDETESRHVGYIAQKVWLAMKESGLEESDFAGFIRDMQDEGSVYTYGLIYSEFIPILHAKIKQLEQRIEEQKQHNKSLEERIEKLEQMLEQK